MNTRDNYLDSVVRKILKSPENPDVYIPVDEYSIIPCARNKYLDENFDPFQWLSFKLMTETIRAKYGFTEDQLNIDDIQ